MTATSAAEAASTTEIPVSSVTALMDAVTVNDGIKVLVQSVGRCLLPYPDPRRRRRLRRNARALVSWTKWPGDDATPIQVAELTLIRLLWLQRQVHRAAHLRQKDATALLARAAIETCITGMWCLYGVDTVPRLRSQNAHALKAMMKNFVGSLISEDFLDRAVASVGEPKGPMSLASMVDLVLKANGPDVVTNLYERYYIPASSLYAHGGGMAMLRQVDHSGAPAKRPYSGWLRRSAVHVTDGCVAALAYVVAKNGDRPTEPFEAYADAHLRRALTPIASMGGGDSLRSLQPKSLPRAYRGYRTAQAYLRSETYESDDTETSQAIVGAAVGDMLSLVRRTGSEPALELLVEELVRQLSQGSEAPSGQRGSTY
jgi:hypothetical protein